MATALEHESILNPVTALSSLRVHAHRPLLLAGEGPFLKIYEHGSTCSLLQQRIFKSHVVHGIAVEAEDAIPSRPRRVLLWGGCSIRVVEIFYSDNDLPVIGIAPRLGINPGPEFSSPDWILDACFSPRAAHGEESHVRIALVTAHNSLHLLTTRSDQQNQLLSNIGSSSRSILYSAHILWISDSHILVAAGTVFGEILVWSCYLTNLLYSQVCENESRTLLHYTLTGHEGSIFGVQISPLLDLGGDRLRRLLASCSDDRTIRVWDISAVDIESQAEPYISVHTEFNATGDLALRSLARSKNIVTIGWGHSSRVWGVRFLPTVPDSRHHPQQITMMSFGEDATCRQWSLKYDDETASYSAASKERLKSTHTYNPHSGKNIWSLGTITEGKRLLISTGGADGKITTVGLPICGNGAKLNQPCDVGWSLEDIESLVQSHMPNSELAEVEHQRAPQRAPPSRFFAHEEDSQAGFRDEDSESLKSNPKSSPNTGRQIPNSFKDYAFVSQSDFLITTAQGKIFLCSVDPSSNKKEIAIGHPHGNSPPYDIRCKLLADLDKLKAYSALGSDPTSKTAFFSGSEGTVYFYDHTSGDVQSLFRVDGKVLGLFPALSSCLLRVLVTCVGSRKAYLGALKADQERSRWSMAGLSGYPKDSLATTLELPDTFVVTSMGIASMQNLIFLGSRSGALAIYDISEGSHLTAELAPTECFRRLHGVDAITVISPLPEYGNSPADMLSTFVLTAGRNGTYAIHQISMDFVSGNRNPTLSTVHVSTPPFGPMVEGAYFDPLTRELILYGFRGKNFIVWNESKECEIMNIECGGSHRNWSFSPSPTGGGGGIFVWTKTSTLRLHTQLLDSQHVIKSGGHGREIKASAISPPLTVISKKGEGVTCQLLATGSEDTAIRIFELDQDCPSNSAPFKSLGTFKKHTTGIQNLQWTECGRRLISSGGFEELFIWRVSWIPGFGVGICCEGICPAEAELPDLRIVSFAVGGFSCCSPVVECGSLISSGDGAEFVITMVYSDSTIKAYRYSPRSRSFRLLLVGRYATCCLTQIFNQRIMNGGYILTAGTDGHIALWKVPNLLDHRILEQADGIDDIRSVEWQWRSRVHKSTVKSMTIVQTTPHSILAITGGDDSALALTHINFNHDNNDDMPSPSSSTIRIPNGHASAITAITHIPTTADPHRILFATSSNDQKLKLWSVGLRDKEGLEVRRECSVGTAVADASSMVVGKEGVEGVARVVVCGVGMEGWRVWGTRG